MNGVFEAEKQHVQKALREGGKLDSSVVTGLWKAL